MRRGIKVTMALAAAAFALAPTAGAAEPTNQACLGEDFSSYAREGSPEGGLLSFAPGSGFGQFNASLAQTVPGLGLPIQTHLAGNTPDLVVPNTCNDL
jgi:hypothetical protein